MIGRLEVRSPIPAVCVLKCFLDKDTELQIAQHDIAIGAWAFAWMVVAPDEQVVPYVAFLPPEYVWVNGTTVVKHFEVEQFYI